MTIQLLTPGAVVGSHYRVVKMLGKGRVGTTYGAIDLRSEQGVVLKELAFEAGMAAHLTAKLEAEAKILEQLTHSGIPRYLGHLNVREGNLARFYTVQELAEGRSLASRVRDGWRPNEKELRELAMQVLDILSYVHGHVPPVVHKDVKPSNIILGEERVSLVDFGAVQAVYLDAVTIGRARIGTVGYMAPEATRGEVGPPADLYGLGLSLIFALTQRSPAELPHRRLRADFRRLARVSDRLASWIDRLQEPMLEDRYRTPEGALLALRVPESKEKDKKTPSPAGQPGRKSLLVLALIGGNVLLAVLLVVVLAILFSRPAAAPDATGGDISKSAVVAKGTRSKGETDGGVTGSSSVPDLGPRPTNVKRYEVDDLRTPARPNYSLKFMGGTRVRTAERELSPQGMTAITLEVWFRVDKLKGPKELGLKEADRPVVSLMKLDGLGFSLRLHDRVVYFGRTSYVSTPRVVRYGQWHHVAGTWARRSRELRIHFDGSLVGNGKEVPGKIEGDKISVVMGGGVSTKLPDFTVSIDEVRCWSYARSGRKISRAKDYELSGLERGLLGYWTFNEGKGQAVRDRTPDWSHGWLGDSASTRDADPAWTKNSPF